MMQLMNNILRPNYRLTKILNVRHYADKWYPDPEFMEQFKHSVMYPDATTLKWKV